MQSISNNIYKAKRQLRNSTALHEANFSKLARVVPDIRDFQGHMSLSGRNNSKLEIQILETSKYTKTFSLLINHGITNQHVSQPWVSDMQMKIRNYYDASVTEVISFQNQHRLSARYPYPNHNMHQRNEKWQINQFLGEWLDYCLRRRCYYYKDIEIFDI